MLIHLTRTTARGLARVFPELALGLTLFTAVRERVRATIRNAVTRSSG
jgi:hypothetical protein